jgi:hypothetical protein
VPALTRVSSMEFVFGLGAERQPYRSRSERRWLYVQPYEGYSHLSNDARSYTPGGMPRRC